MVQRHAHISPTKSAEFRQLGTDGGVILHLETKAFFQLNELGAAIWTMLSSGITFSELLTRLQQEVEQAPPELDADVARFVRELKARDLVTVEDSSAVPLP